MTAIIIRIDAVQDPHARSPAEIAASPTEIWPNGVIEISILIMISHDLVGFSGSDTCWVGLTSTPRQSVFATRWGKRGQNWKLTYQEE